MANVLKQLVVLLAAIATCVGQADNTTVHIQPRMLQGSAAATSDTSERTTPRPVKVDVDLVLVLVMVTDQTDRVVLGLESDNSRIFDRNSEQVIRHFFSRKRTSLLGKHP